jgi:hypothetical protein
LLPEIFFQGLSLAQEVRNSATFIPSALFDNLSDLAGNFICHHIKLLLLFFHFCDQFVRHRAGIALALPDSAPRIASLDAGLAHFYCHLRMAFVIWAVDHFTGLLPVPFGICLVGFGAKASGRLCIRFAVRAQV